MEIRYISLYDLLSFKESYDLIMSDNMTEFYDLLWELGFNTNDELEFQEVYCRSRIDHRIICLGRWVGFERTDEEWLNSKYCTMENRVLCAMHRDTELGFDMDRMMRTANFTGRIIEHMEDSGLVATVNYEDENAIYEMMVESDRIKQLWEKYGTTTPEES